MSISTRTKRASVIGVGRPWLRTKQPDATTPQAWRQATGLTYYLAPVVGGGPFCIENQVAYRGGSQASVHYAGGSQESEHYAGGSNRAKAGC